MPAMLGPRNSQGQTAHYTNESADVAEPTDPRSTDVHDTEAQLLMMFAEATSPDDRAMLAEAIQHCANLRHSMPNVSDHTRDTEQVLAAFEQCEGMRSPAAYRQPDNTNMVMELESSSSKVFQPWGAGGPKLCADDDYIFTATESLTPAPVTVDAGCTTVLPDYCTVAPPAILMPVAASATGHQYTCDA